MSARRAPQRRASPPLDEPEGYVLRWSRRAEADLETIGEYIAADNPVAAAQWVERLLLRANTAAHFPFAGRVVPEFRSEDLREVFVRNYRIVYRIREHEVHVITVFEGHRLFPQDADIEDDPCGRLRS